MKKRSLLFVCARMPLPAKEGHQLRTIGLLRELSEHYRVHLLSILRPGETTDHDELKEICASVTGVPVELGTLANLTAVTKSVLQRKPIVVTRYVTPSLKRAFSSLMEEHQPNIVHLDLLPLMELATSVHNDAKIILNEHNVESLLLGQKLETITSPLLRWIYKREFTLVDRFERAACARADLVLACSDLDTQILKGMGAKSVHTIPNGVDVDLFDHEHPHVNSERLVFLGGMGWYPNRLGMQWFVNDVLPLITRQKPEIHVDVIGNPEPHISIPEAVRKHVTLHGFVDDFRPIVSQAGMMIVPLNVGSGTRLKVVEGAAMGKCMVSTSKGAEGVNLVDEQDIILADTASSFAEKILSLSVDEQKVRCIGQAARKVAESTYDWKVIGTQFRYLIESIYPSNTGLVED